MQYEQAVYVNAQTGEVVELPEGDATVQLSPDELLDALIEENKKLNGVKAKIAALKKDNKFHKKNNPDGIDGEEVKQIAKTAVRFAAADFEEKKQEQLEFFAFYEERTNYNE